MEIFNHPYLLELFITAFVFTIVGHYWGRNSFGISLRDIIDTTVDRLIEEGYIRTEGKGSDLKLLKYWESGKGEQK